jgi:hypothetical protein
MDDVMMAEGPGSTDILAVTDDVRQGLENTVAAAASFTAFSKATCGVERHRTQASAVEESPISKSSVEARFKHVVGFTSQAGDGVHFSLVGFL